MAVTIYEALALIENHLPALSTEIVPIELAVGRVASQNLRATIALPTFNNSAMDGYGLCGDAESYTLKGKILAGDSHSYDLKEGECIKILTGARVPDSVDTIVPQENVRVTDTTITVEKPVRFGAHIRYRGEDINENEGILSEGETITAAHIALLASQGVTHVEVYRKVRVAVFAGGSELKLHFEPLGPSQVYNSNTYHLLSRSQELGCETRFAGKSEDNVESLKRLVASALDCDLIVTSGGVSVGEADFTREAFGALGMETIFQKVQIKPGKPTTFGRIGNTLVLNLPGNPLASILNFELFGKFLIHKLQGCRDAYHAPIETVAAKEILSPRPVANVIPGFFNGSSFTPVEKFAPGMVNVLNRCNGIIVVDPESDTIGSGGKVGFLPIRWRFGAEEFREFMS